MVDKNKVREANVEDVEFAFKKDGLFGNAPLRIRAKKKIMVGKDAGMFFLSADESKGLYNFLDDIYGNKKKDK